MRREFVCGGFAERCGYVYTVPGEGAPGLSRSSRMDLKMKSERERSYNREYCRRPDVVAKRKAYQKQHNQLPEIKEKNRRRNKERYLRIYIPKPRLSYCKKIIAQHHEELKDDPERLKTDFLINMTGCKCKRKENDKAVIVGDLKMCKTTCKSKYPNRQKRVHFICPICKESFTLSQSEARKYQKKGYPPCDTMICGRLYAKRRKAGKNDHV
jgi:predicted RNA-binding Zn-ribbon protein involved in translation (DUF1610 family)